MHPPSRARRILKWTGTGLSFLILSAWIASLWYTAYVYSPARGMVGIGRGSLAVEITDSSVALPTIAQATFKDVYRRDFQGLGLILPRRSTTTVNPTHMPSYSMSGAVLPFWILLTITAMPTAWLWHRDRRLISSSPDHLLCSGCGYDLTGNLSGVCPECGLAKPPVR